MLFNLVDVCSGMEKNFKKQCIFITCSTSPHPSTKISDPLANEFHHLGRSICPGVKNMILTEIIHFFFTIINLHSRPEPLTNTVW